MPVPDGNLRPVYLRHQDDVARGGPGCCLKGLIVQAPRCGKVPFVVEPVSLEVQYLGDQRIVLLLLRQVQRCFQIPLGFVKASDQSQRVSMAAQDLGQPEAAVLERLKGLESFLLRI